MPSPLTCPYCQRHLREVDHHGAHIDACDCGGMWFDSGEIAEWVRGSKLKALVPDGTNDAPFHSDPYRCPRCAELSLHSRVLDGVHFARCDRCAGIWLTPQGVVRMNPAFGAERAHGDRAVGDVFVAFLELLSWAR